MPRNTLDYIREKFRRGHYDISAHAMEQVADDRLDIIDVETTVYNGDITRVERDDPRGTKYVIEGIAVDQKTPVGMVGRFTSTGRFLVITVYEITEPEE